MFEEKVESGIGVVLILDNSDSDSDDSWRLCTLKSPAALVVPISGRIFANGQVFLACCLLSRIQDFPGLASAVTEGRTCCLEPVLQVCMSNAVTWTDDVSARVAADKKPAASRLVMLWTAILVVTAGLS